MDKWVQYVATWYVCDAAVCIVTAGQKTGKEILLYEGCTECVQFVLFPSSGCLVAAVLSCARACGGALSFFFES